MHAFKAHAEAMSSLSVSPLQDYEDDEMSHASLSSGLSPRESRPRTKPWDLQDGYKVGCAKVLGVFGPFKTCMICRHI